MKRLIYIDRKVIEKLIKTTEKQAYDFGKSRSVVAYVVGDRHELLAIVFNNRMQFGVYHVYWSPESGKVTLSENPLSHCTWEIKDAYHYTWYDLTKMVYYKVLDHMDVIMYNSTGNHGFEMFNKGEYDRVKHGMFSMWVPPEVPLLV